MKRLPATAPMTFIPIVFGSIVKQPSMKVPPCASASTKRVVTPVPSQKIETSRHSSRRSTSRSWAAAPKGPFMTPR